MEKIISLKKIFFICLCNVAWAYISFQLLIISEWASLGSWIEGLTVYAALLFSSLLVLRYTFNKFKNNFLRYFCAILLVFSSWQISLSIGIFYGSAHYEHSLLKAIADSLIFSFYISIFIIFWAWLLAGTVIYFIYYLHDRKVTIIVD